MSLSINMLNIQIDSKINVLVIHHNMKLSFFARYMKWSFPLATFITCCTVIRSFRVSHKKIHQFHYFYNVLGSQNDHE